MTTGLLVLSLYPEGPAMGEGGARIRRGAGGDAGGDGGDRGDPGDGEARGL